MKIFENKKIFLFINLIIYSYLFCLNYFQIKSVHWSYHFDTDFWNIYNLILVNSGFEQEFFGHPATSLYFFSKIFFNVFEPVLDSKLDLESFKRIENYNIYFNKIYFFVRQITYLISITCLYFIYKILRKLNFPNLLIIISLLTFVISDFFLDNFFQYRPELLSIMFFLISFYLVLKLHNTNRVFLICFLIGFFCCLSFLSKFQIIFGLLSILFIIPFFIKKNLNLKIDNKKFKLIINIYIIFLILYFIIVEYFFVQKLNILDNNFKIDFIFLILLNIFYIFVNYLLFKKKIENLKISIICGLLFILGFYICFSIFLFFDLINYFKINNGLVVYLFLPLEKLGTYNYNQSLVEFINNIKFDYLSIITFFSFFIYMIRSNKKDYNQLLLLLIIFSTFTFYFLTTATRYFNIYLIYPYVIFFIFMCLFYKFDRQLIKYSIVIFFVFSIINTFFVKDVKRYFVYKNYFVNCKSLEWERKIKRHDILWTKRILFSEYKNICDDVLNEKK